MTTATKTKTRASTELRKLEDARTKAHAKTLDLKAKASAWGEQTEAMRAELTRMGMTDQDQFTDLQHLRDTGVGTVGVTPRPGTRAAELEAEIKKRIAGPNPFDADHLKARGEFHAADEAVSEFKIARCTDRLDELEPEFQAAEDSIRQAAADLLRASEEYKANVEQARAVIGDTPILDRPAAHDPPLNFDPRPAEWSAIARDILDTEIVKPGLTPTAAWKLENHNV
jgi:hypothetical protein